MDESLWIETSPSTHFPVLRDEAEVDVAIVGGGVVGLTAAYLLQRAGRSVVVFEQGRIGTGESGASTAHLSLTLDLPYSELRRRLGRGDALRIVRGQRAALAAIETFVAELGIDCGYRALPGFLFADDEAGLRRLFAEAEILPELGIESAMLGSAELAESFATLSALPLGALRLESQAQLHPLRYVTGLARAFAGLGGRIFEQTRILTVDDDGPQPRLQTSSGLVSAREVLVTTNFPISIRGSLYSRISPSRTYVVAYAADGRPALSDALYWDCSDPYHYVRYARMDGRTFLVVGGEDHRTLEVADSQERFERLESYAARWGAVGASDYRWSGQVIASADGLPYVGLSPVSSRILIATGFGGNGLTLGSLAAFVLRDHVLGHENGYTELLRPSRPKRSAARESSVPHFETLLQK